MCEPFIHNHQYNLVKNQADLLLQAYRTASDSKVLESVKYSVETKILELFPDATAAQKQMLGAVSVLRAAEEFQAYLKALQEYLLPFPAITAKQIQKLFPKNKKLKLPDLAGLDYRFMTYLSWVDISTNKLFIVVPMNGQFVGVEGRYTLTHKKSYCFVCNQFEELALFTAVSRKRPANTSPDYYKAVGNYLCMDGHECNKNITDTASLEQFVSSVIG
ncbi:FusB/FusC family EF-G-binding protein [Paenibacillus hexagrammi]|uniref:FusB/FusC family EF-G-binding protein n=1 Tax=Paenibacillus hexagrammi TaxID=2908839 RepID=A0ABY3SFM3_9BACL|nr:FusB/FusC family EF-G-binding protein [Paenibacillus sp. YPD9-1]UJF32797.1 FusB/FusC family EF-G-binding protein [Paenibacillus sp. YPD9-1]